jgi:hypothetical protein
MWTTILASILVPVTAIVVLLIMLLRFPRSSLTLPVVMLAASANWGYIYGLYMLQRGAYKTWDRTGNIDELLAYKYDMKRAVLVGVGVSVLFMVSGTIMSTITSQPNTFESADMTITYPNTWAKQDFSLVPNCKQANIECIIVLADARFGSTQIVLVKTPLPPGISSGQAVELQTWSLLQQQNPSLKLDYRGVTIQVSGIPAYARYYSLANPQNRNESFYGMQLYFIKGAWIYELTAASVNKGIFQEMETPILDFIEGIHLK